MTNGVKKIQTQVHILPSTCYRSPAPTPEYFTIVTVSGVKLSALARSGPVFLVLRSALH